jgi:hypothetical protein
VRKMIFQSEMTQTMSGMIGIGANDLVHLGSLTWVLLPPEIPSLLNRKSSRDPETHFINKIGTLL